MLSHGQGMSVNAFHAQDHAVPYQQDTVLIKNQTHYLVFWVVLFSGE